jgi:Fur family transcriptional regulator, ferric uptake regulator
MSSKARERKDEELRQLLSARGIRVTEQRLLILRELSKLRAPISHGELTDRLAGHALDRATIYRNLLSLTDAGILVRTQLGDNVWRFEMPSSASAGHGAHPHFVCTDCGDVACLPRGAVRFSGGEIARIEVAEVQLRGRCGECVER